IPLGYFNDPVKTERTFPRDPDGRRWVMSGDYGTVAGDGSIVLLGRGSAVINTGGEKVYPEEVESVLKAHPDVADTIVVPSPDELLGQRVTAVIAPVPGRSPSPERLREHCRTRLAGFKVPRAFRVVDRVRRTAVGKQDYRWAAAVAPGRAAAEARQGAAAGRGPRRGSPRRSAALPLRDRWREAAARRLPGMRAMPGSTCAAAVPPGARRLRFPRPPAAPPACRRRIDRRGPGPASGPRPGRAAEGRRAPDPRGLLRARHREDRRVRARVRTGPGRGVHRCGRGPGRPPGGRDGRA